MAGPRPTVTWGTEWSITRNLLDLDDPPLDLATVLAVHLTDLRRTSDDGSSHCGGRSRRAERASWCSPTTPALAAAIVRLLTDHAYADLLAKGGHDLVHERFCVELMVASVEGLYDEGAQAIRRPLVEAAAAS